MHVLGGGGVSCQHFRAQKQQSPEKFTNSFIPSYDIPSSYSTPIRKPKNHKIIHAHALSLLTI